MEGPGWKSDIMGVVGLHEVRVYIKGNFLSFNKVLTKVNNVNNLRIVSDTLFL